MDNQKYNDMKAKHPEWSDDQIWTAISLQMETDNVIERNNGDVNPDDPDIIKTIIVGARHWLSEVLPTIFEKVKSFFDNLISTIATWVVKGLKYVVELIAKLGV